VFSTAAWTSDDRLTLPEEAAHSQPTVNFEHFDHLFAEIEVDGKTMGVSEAADAVQRAGYKTSAANFRTIVNQTMLKSPKIKKVSRGQYTAK